ncbi:Hypothetical protein PHPALM_19703 [Phytophthora palmivora]|uniref:Uncharacterized protein n=1 Tax=Phytophthora palmivora TaxID=4796 RepID=A0A2P4XGR4_9STRA|nr:Hypothetical protein PHPALM_19703 [Phytophthora palmivora]
MHKIPVAQLPIFRTRSNTTVGERSTERVRQLKKIPASWVQNSRTFACTHEGKYKSEATSNSPQQETRAKGSKAHINVCVQVVDKQQKRLLLELSIVNWITTIVSPARATIHIHPIASSSMTHNEE